MISNLDMELWPVSHGESVNMIVSLDWKVTKKCQSESKSIPNYHIHHPCSN